MAVRFSISFVVVQIVICLLQDRTDVANTERITTSFIFGFAILIKNASKVGLNPEKSANKCDCRDITKCVSSAPQVSRDRRVAI